MADDAAHSTLAIRSLTGTKSTVAGTTVANTVILAANNTLRLGATIMNDQGTNQAKLYIAMGATCSLTDFTEVLLPNDSYEVPYGYAGIITGIFSAATGTARVTEFT